MCSSHDSHTHAWHSLRVWDWVSLEMLCVLCMIHVSYLVHWTYRFCLFNVVSFKIRSHWLIRFCFSVITLRASDNPTLHDDNLFLDKYLFKIISGFLQHFDDGLMLMKSDRICSENEFISYNIDCEMFLICLCHFSLYFLYQSYSTIVFFSIFILKFKHLFIY